MNNLKRFWPWFRDLGLIVIGALAQAVGLRLFLVPANLASGGVSGIAQLINNYTNWPIGLMVFIGNLPLFIIGWRYLGGRRFGLRTATAVISFSFFVDFLALYLPKNGITDDIFLNSLYGAVLATVWSTADEVPAAAATSWRAFSITGGGYLCRPAI